jgi:hypothetical protein
MPNIQDLELPSVFRCMVIAPFKTGKTWGAGTFPRPNFIDFDEGTDVFRNPAFIKKYGLRDIKYERFREKSRDTKGVVKTHNAFDDACRYFDSQMKAGVVDTFDTWVVDSTTTMSMFARNKAIVLLGSKALGIASKTHEQAINTGLIYPKQQDYGSERSMIEQFVDMLKESGKHLVLLAHEQTFTDDAGNVTDIGPMLTGGSRQAIPLKFDEVYHLRIKKQGTEFVRYLQTQPDTIRKCGTRLGVTDGTSWEWDAIQTELKKLREQALAENRQPSATKSL